MAETLTVRKLRVPEQLRRTLPTNDLPGQPAEDAGNARRPR